MNNLGWLKICMHALNEIPNYRGISWRDHWPAPLNKKFSSYDLAHQLTLHLKQAELVQPVTSQVTALGRLTDLMVVPNGETLDVRAFVDGKHIGTCGIDNPQAAFTERITCGRGFPTALKEEAGRMALTWWALNGGYPHA